MDEPKPKDNDDGGSTRGDATGFYFGFNNDAIHAHTSAAGGRKRSASDPHTTGAPCVDERMGVVNPRAKHSRFLSASHSFRTARSSYNPRPYFRSRRIKKGTIDRPELRVKDPRAIWITIIPVTGFLIGLAAIVLLSWSGYTSIKDHKYCEVFVDDFSNGFNSSIWTKHVETGGYG